MTIRKFLKYFIWVLVFVSFILGSASRIQPGAAMPSLRRRRDEGPALLRALPQLRQ